MATSQIDGVVVAVRYTDDGQVDWVRAYKRRGPTWSDHMRLTRQELIAALKEGQRYVVGSRVPLMASTFETSEPLRLDRTNGQETLVSGRPSSDGRDHLEGVPLI